MGYIPDIRIEHDFRSQGDKYVCIECFGDYAIQEFIEKFAESKKCDYCKKSSKKHNIAANINDVILFILEGVETEWGDPNNEGVGWDSGEGGYYSAVVIYSYDLFTEELDLGIEREELLSDIIDAFSDDMWCQKDPHGHTLRVTELAVADELAAAAGLLMGKLERIPAVLIRDYHFPAAEGRARSLVRSAERDLFR